MTLHRTNADVELFGNLRIGVTQGDQAQHVPLPLAQLVAVSLVDPRRQLGAEGRLQVGVADGGAAHRLDQLGVGGLLEHVAAHAGLQGAAGKGGLVLHRQHDDLRLR